MKRKRKEHQEYITKKKKQLEAENPRDFDNFSDKTDAVVEPQIDVEIVGFFLNFEFF